MKQIFTLCAATLLSVTSAFSQNSQTFEGITDFTSLTENCWQFTNLGLSSTSVVYGTNSAYTNTTINANAYVVTPYINLTTSTTIAFDYKLVGSMTGNSKRYIRVNLIDINNVSTSLGSVTFNPSSTNDIKTFSATSPLTGVQKLQIEITSGSEGTTAIHVDNINITGTFNYNSPYGCNTTANSPLPIHLKNFQGLANQDNIQLNWAVADNETGSYFEIEKSADGKDFKTIAVVSTSQKSGDENYMYNDIQQASAYYRLKIVNNNKSVTYSHVLLIKKQGTSANTLSLLQNPVKETLKFNFVSETNALTEISVYNMLGVKVFKTTFQASKGTNLTTTKLDAQIKGGTYVLEVKNVTNRSIAKFLKD